MLGCNKIPGPPAVRVAGDSELISSLGVTCIERVDDQWTITLGEEEFGREVLFTGESTETPVLSDVIIGIY